MSAVADWQGGWLGIGLIGLLGLVITTRVDLHGGHAVGDVGHGASGVGLLAKQIEAREAHSSPEQRMAEAAERAKRSRGLYILNTVLICMTVFGFGLFVLHQLP